MKSRLSSTIWALVLFNGLAYLAVLWLAFSAGKKAGDTPGLDFGSPAVVGALGVALVMSVILAWRLGALLRLVQAFTELSERLVAGDPRSRAEVEARKVLGDINHKLYR